LTGAFCAACGQKDAPLNPTVRDFLHELVGELLNFDGKIFRSIRLLFLRPGFLAHERFLGRRTRYSSPLRLYLIFSVIFLTALAFAPDLGQATYTPDPDEVIDPAALAAQNAAMLARANVVFHLWIPRAMFLLVPVFAAFVMLACRGRGRTYPQHLYFALNVHAAAFGVFALMAAASTVEVPALSAVVQVVLVSGEVFVIVHFGLALRRAYETTALGAVWRSALIVALYLMVLAFMMYLFFRFFIYYAVINDFSR
jgi:hypothetical protein